MAKGLENRLIKAKSGYFDFLVLELPHPTSGQLTEEEGKG